MKTEKYRNAVHCKDNLAVHTAQKLVETELIRYIHFMKTESVIIGNKNSGFNRHFVS